MSTIQSNASVQTLAQTLMTSLDSNKDGQLSTDEFTTFLSRLMSSAQTGLTGLTGASAAATATGTTQKFEGFNFEKTVDTAKSAKYAFAAAAKKAGGMPMSKSEAESWFNGSIKSEMEQLGHKIDWVQGDKFQFTNWQGTYVVDFVRGAASSDPALAWQVVE